MFTYIMYHVMMRVLFIIMFRDNDDNAVGGGGAKIKVLIFIVMAVRAI